LLRLEKRGVERKKTSEEGELLLKRNIYILKETTQKRNAQNGK